MEDSLEITVPSNPLYLKLIRQVVAETARMTGFEESDSQKICLAVDEACTNIIRHSYDGDQKQKIIVTFHLSEKKLVIELKDFGKKLDLTKIEKKNTPRTKPGGLGVNLIVSIMDIVEYDKTSDKYNRVKLTKFLKSEGI